MRENKEAASVFSVFFILFLIVEILYVREHIDTVDALYFFLVSLLPLDILYEAIIAMRKYDFDYEGITVTWLEFIRVRYRWEDFVALGFVFAEVPRMGKMKCYICSTKPIPKKKNGKLREYAWYGRRVFSAVVFREDNKLSVLLRENCPYDEIYMPFSIRNTQRESSISASS